LLGSSVRRSASATLQLVEVYDLSDPETGEECISILRNVVFLRDKWEKNPETFYKSGYPD
jgi:hypothetical protein